MEPSKVNHVVGIGKCKALGKVHLQITIVLGDKTIKIPGLEFHILEENFIRDVLLSASILRAESGIGIEQVGHYLEKESPLEGELNKLKEEFELRLQYERAGQVKLEPIDIKAREVPGKIANRSYSRERVSVIDSLIKELVETKAIRKAEVSQRIRYAAPINPVRKEDGSFRLTVDYTLLNQYIDIHPFPMLVIDINLQDRLGGMRYFGKIDLKQGYWQIPITPRMSELCAFRTHDAVYLPLGLPQGLVCSVGLFNMAIANILHGKEEEEDLLSSHPEYVVLVYLDDILIASTKEKVHLEVSRKILDRFVRYRVAVNWKKSILTGASIEWLGLSINDRGIRVSDDKVRGLIGLRCPVKVAELYKLHGSLNWIRHFIPAHNKTWEPILVFLNKTLGKDRAMKNVPKGPLEQHGFGELERKAVEKTMAMVKRQILLSYPVEGEIFAIHSDASENVWAAFLVQFPKEDERKAVSERRNRILYCDGGRFVDSQRNWTIYRKETYAVVQIAIKCRPVLAGGHKIMIYCDNSAAVNFLKPSAEKTKQAVESVRRLVEEVSDLNLIPQHIQGEENIFPDMLTRMTIGEGDESVPLLAFRAGENEDTSLTKASPEETSVLPYLRILAEANESLEELPDIESPYREESGLVREKDYTSGGGETVKGRIYVPEHLLWMVMRELHETVTSHGGRDQVVSLFATSFVTDQVLKNGSLRRKAERVVLCCKLCIMSRYPKERKVIRGQMRRATRPYEIVHLDMADMKVTAEDGKGRGCRFFITARDDFSKYTWAMPIENTSSKEAVRFLDHLERMNEGLPRTLFTDNGPHFSGEFREMCENSGVTLSHSTPLVPQTNSQAELAVRDVKEKLRLFTLSRRLDPTKWPDLMPEALKAINEAQYRKGLGGYSPAEVFHEILHVKRPGNIFPVDWDSVFACIRKFRARRKDPPGRFSDQFFAKGSKVFLSTQKWALRNVLGKTTFPRWVGPWKVTGVRKEKYEVDLSSVYSHWNIPRVHVKFIRAWKSGPDDASDRADFLYFRKCWKTLHTEHSGEELQRWDFQAPSIENAGDFVVCDNQLYEIQEISEEEIVGILIRTKDKDGAILATERTLKEEALQRHLCSPPFRLCRPCRVPTAMVGYLHGSGGSVTAEHPLK